MVFGLDGDDVIQVNISHSNAHLSSGYIETIVNGGAGRDTIDLIADTSFSGIQATAIANATTSGADLAFNEIFGGSGADDIQSTFGFKEKFVEAAMSGQTGPDLSATPKQGE